ncbi:hypothetical protein LCGC14_0829390 [marine sediment metagenome]|uniref:Uncharacterized protein n=2 Tax=marine sediment metagenome TaxID=412755 RepID=A0A0F9PL48_9ZZZZ
MTCPRCGLVMHLLNCRDHSEYSDYLYQCQCGTTHLHISPKNEVQAKSAYMPNSEPGERV